MMNRRFFPPGSASERASVSMSFWYVLYSALIRLQTLPSRPANTSTFPYSLSSPLSPVEP